MNWKDIKKLISQEDSSYIESILNPEVVEFEGGFYLKDKFDSEYFLDWQKRIKGNTNKEKFINHIHIYDIIGNVENENEDLFVSIGEYIESSWKLNLGNKFVVVFSNSEDDYGPTLTFYRAVSDNDC